MELQQQCIEQAINLHNNNPVVDAHLDLAAELVYLVRNGEMNPLRTYYLKNLRAAGVNLVVSSVYQSDRQLLEEGYEGALWQIHVLQEAIRADPEFMEVRTCKDLDMALATGRIGVLLYMKDWTASEQTLNGYISCGSWESGAHLSPGAGKMRWLTAAAKQESGYRSPVVLRPLEHVRSVRWNRWGCFWM